VTGNGASGCTELIIGVVWLSASVLSAMVLLLRLIDVVVDAEATLQPLLRVQDEPGVLGVLGLLGVLLHPCGQPGHCFATSRQ